MSKLTISFNQEWLIEQRDNNNRIIRRLEKWLVARKGIILKSCNFNSLTIELPTDEREKLLDDLLEYLKTDLNNDSPWNYMTLDGDIAGLNVPDKKSPQMQENKLVPRSKQEVSVKTEKNLSPPQQNPSETVKNICSRIPVCHCRELEAYVRETAEVIPMLQKMGAESSLWHQHLLLAIDAGYGRSTFLKDLVLLYKAFGLIPGEIDKKSVLEYILLPNGEEHKKDGYRVSWDDVLDAAQNMERTNSRNGISKAVLYIDISEWLPLLNTRECKIRLRRLNSLCGTFLIVFRVPFLEGHILRETAEALNDILNVRTIPVPPVPVDSMIDYAQGELLKNGFKLADNARGSFEQVLLSEKVDDSFFGYKTVDKVLRKMIYNKALVNCRTKATECVIGLSDFEIISNADNEDSPVSELNNLIGMQNVIQRINEIIVQIKTQKKMAAQGKKVAMPSIHMLFTGNPGTGKTTVARIVARMMKQAGILRKGHLVEVKGRDLCGRYVGETAPKTSAICRDAYGSVLFIDEAYSLFRADTSSSWDYGREALDTLVAEMDNHRDDLCVIMAGYKEDMENMLSGNAGLRGRIPYEIEFPNYTRSELEEIFFSMVNSEFDYEDDLKNAVHDFFAEIPQEIYSSKEFSNARLVRNLYERTWCKAAYRQNMDGSALRILKSDLVGATSDSEFKKLLKKNVERPVIGFAVK